MGIPTREVPGASNCPGASSHRGGRPSSRTIANTGWCSGEAQHRLWVPTWRITDPAERGQHVQVHRPKQDQGKRVGC